MQQPTGSWRARDRLRALILRYAALLAAVCLVVFMTFDTLRMLYTNARTADQNEALALSLMHLQIDEETSVRGYERTHLPTFLEPYRMARTQIDRRAHELQARFAPSDRERVLLEQFVACHRRWVAMYAQPILQTGSIPSLAAERAAKAQVDRMRGEIDAIAGEQNIRLARAQHLANNTFVLAEGSVVALILCVASVGFFMERRAGLREEEYVRQILTERDNAMYLGDWRSKVIGMLAHDFRSALTVIDTAIMLMEDFPDEVDRARTTDRVHHEVQSLAEMTESALLMARVASGDIPISKKPVAIVPVLDEIAQRYRHSREIYINGPALVVAGDRPYLVRIFDNLIANAVKYSDGDSPVTVMVTEREGGSIAEILIVDRGPGIDPADLPHVFKEYWRAPASRKNEGNGLGLFIVKKLVDAHGGTIDIRSDPGFGTSIYVRLPAV